MWVGERIQEMKLAGIRRFAAMRARRVVAWVSALPPKCAVFAVNDDTAVEVMSACEKAGRKIPSDLTLLGVDR